MKTISSFLKLVLSLALALLLGSCEDPINVDIPEGETLVVVDAFLNDKPEPQQVRLTYTGPYFSNKNVPALTGAVVSLTDLSNGKIYNFSDLGNGNYLYTPVNGDTMAVLDHDYRLDVQWDGHTYFTESTLKRTTPVDTIIFEKQESGQGFQEGYYPYIYAFDQPGGKDFYWVKAFKNGQFINEPQNINVTEDAGGEGTDGLAFIPPVAFFSVTPSDEPYQLENENGIPDICTIEIHSINKETYDFFIQAQTQMTNSSSGLFATTPENVRTNIVSPANATKAIGWFVISSVKSKTLSVQ